MFVGDRYNHSVSYMIEGDTRRSTDLIRKEFELFSSRISKSSRIAILTPSRSTACQDFPDPSPVGPYSAKRRFREVVIQTRSLPVGDHTVCEGECFKWRV